MLNRKVEIWLALIFLVLAGLAMVVWIPFDSETPPIYEFRRQTYIGDAMLPMVAAGGIVVCALVQLVMQFRRPARSLDSAPMDGLTIVFFAMFISIVTVSCLLMFWAGPIALSLFGPLGTEDAPVTYRQMRTTLPWKHVGFVLGGFTLVFGLTSLVEGTFSAKRAVSSFLAVIVLILIFDMPFDTILLPPNGDF